MRKQNFSSLEPLFVRLATRRAVVVAWAIPVILGAFGILFYAYSITVTEDEGALQRRIAEVEQARVFDIENELTGAVERTERIGDLLALHRDGAAPLRLLEEHLQPEIAVSNITIDYELPVMTVSVQAPNAGAIARQASAFEDDSRIVSVDVMQISRVGDVSAYRGDIVIRLDAAVLSAFPKFTQ